MKAMPKEIEEYFSNYQEEALRRLILIRELVFELLPDAQETIKYGIPTFVHHGNLLHYAGFKNHTGFYPIPSGITAFKDELSRYKQGKGSIQFPLKEDFPLELIRKIVVFRIKESL